MELRLEMVTVPAANFDRAKVFYVDRVRFSVELDIVIDEGHRFMELLPHGSPCSIALTGG